MLEILMDVAGLAAEKKYPAVRKGVKLFYAALLLGLAGYVGYAFLVPGL